MALLIECLSWQTDVEKFSLGLLIFVLVRNLNLPFLMLLGMVVEVPLGGEAFHAPCYIAMIWLLPGMDSHVSLQVALFVKRPLAVGLRAYELLVPHVGLNMNL
jgi:hypothetical protein